ncbi:MAG: hypothetical protein WA997_18845 [Anaerolineales bacterium]|jgi:hypothetical protein
MMKRAGYKQYIAEYVFRFPINTPIYTEDVAIDLADHFHITIAHAKTLVNVNLPRIAETHDLVRYQKGIYYKAQNTPFGKTKLNPALITRDRYTQKNGVTTGYETGASFLNQIGLTTQIPKYKKYATNIYKYRGNKADKKLKVVIRKPRVEITEDNYLYLQLLDAIANKDKLTFDALHPETIILNYIKDRKLDFKKLVGYAGMHYNEKTLSRISKIASAGII